MSLCNDQCSRRTSFLRGSNTLTLRFTRTISMIIKNREIVLIKHHSRTRVKLTALYKQLDKNHTYIHFNKQNLECSICHQHYHLANNKYSYIYTTPTQRNTNQSHAHESVSHYPLKYELQSDNY